MKTEDFEQNMKIAEMSLAKAKEEILDMFDNCPHCETDIYYSFFDNCSHCEADIHFSSENERWFIFSREKNKMKDFLHVKVFWVLKEFTGVADTMNEEGFRSLEIQLEIADRLERESGMAIFKSSTAFGLSAVDGDYGVVTQLKWWLDGFVKNWVEADSS